MPFTRSTRIGSMPSHKEMKNRKQSRKPSIAEIILPQQQQPHRIISHSSTFHGDYRTLPTSKERIKKAKRLLLEITDENQDWEDDEEFLKPIITEFIEAQKAKGLSEQESMELVIECYCVQ